MVAEPTQEEFSSNGVNFRLRFERGYGECHCLGCGFKRKANHQLLYDVGIEDAKLLAVEHSTKCKSRKTE